MKAISGLIPTAPRGPGNVFTSLGVRRSPHVPAHCAGGFMGLGSPSTEAGARKVLLPIRHTCWCARVSVVSVSVL